MLCKREPHGLHPDHHGFERTPIYRTCGQARCARFSLGTVDFAAAGTACAHTDFDPRPFRSHGRAAPSGYCPRSQRRLWRLPSADSAGARCRNTRFPRAGCLRSMRYFRVLGRDAGKRRGKIGYGELNGNLAAMPPGDHGLPWGSEFGASESRNSGALFVSARRSWRAIGRRMEPWNGAI